MSIKGLLADFVIAFGVTLVVSVIVTLLWNTVVQRSTTIDWESSFRFAIVLGIILPLIEMRRSRR